MRYISTRGGMAPQPFTSILLEGLAPDGGLAVPERYPRFSTRRSRATAAAGLSRSGVRDPLALHGRHRAGRPARDHRPHLHRRRVRQRRHHPADDARAGAVPAARVAWTDARVQGRGAAIARQPVRARARAAGRDAQHPRRDLGRYRSLGRVRDARQAQRRRVHAHAARQDEPVPGRADVRLARPEHFQHRHRRRVRRLPGHRQGGQRATPSSSGAIASARSIRSTGRAWRRRSSTTSRATSAQPRTTASRSASRCRRATSATSWRVTSRGRWGSRSTS